FTQVEIQYQQVENLLRNDYPDNKKLAQEKADVESIKRLLDSIKAIQWFVKPLLGKGNEPEKENKFYGEFTVLWEALNQITPLYNKVRNFVTSKPYSDEKIKINFENSYFLSGWPQDYESKGGLIFEKDGLFYLAVNNKKLSQSEKSMLTENFHENPAKRIVLDFQKPDNKNVPRIFIRSKGDNFAPAVQEYNLPIDDIIDIYDKGKFKTEYRNKGGQDYLESLHKLIDYFKLGFKSHQSYKHYDYIWKPTNEYRDIAEFYKDVIVSCYRVNFQNVNWSVVESFVSQGKFYLFQIYNKDFSPNSKGTPNMHTLYWKMLFNEENLKNIVYQLNGQAEVFYRKLSINDENRVIHKAKESIANKNELNTKKQSVFDYDIIKDRRYTMDKFLFHVPITLNFKSEGLNNINTNVNSYLQRSKNTHIIGIDRGERHLLYLTLINPKGEIVKQFSLNEIVNEYNGNTYKTNYHDLLDKREKARLDERESWKTIETIKELKEGYISQVIHKITDLMAEYSAIVVLEDLNFGFMRGRQKVEKQVYQKFEKMLIDKLNYLVDKQKGASEFGGTLKALQLTNKFESFKAMGKQNGFLYYVPAWNTSKIDPVTGFVNFFATKYESTDKAKEFFAKFKAIRFNAQKQYFEFVVDNYTLFNAKAEGTQQNWTICTYSDRIKTFRNPEKNNEWDNQPIILTQAFIDFFKKQGIDHTVSNLKELIISQQTKDFFEGLLQLFKLTVQMRNSITNSDVDFLISPVADKNGNFYDSRTAGLELPKDADANGAYNIARKGQWVLEQIRKPDADLKRLKLAISNKEWLQFVQK
ncbi:MAG: type V CRISPR-associated protein Cas12a/Cpf1, partial [Salinivirgaceae bacterium]|nr:type V CRISPR-associated protein Cas12a/Cpf1 [Salinivirgaceae bacterium]